jgi:hypothetical protein
MDATLDTVERFGAMLGYLCTVLVIYQHLRQLKMQRDAPHEKRLDAVDKRLDNIENWRRDVERGFTANNNERWTDNARRWDTFRLYVRDQHALNQATIGAQLVILDRMLKESDDEDLKNAKDGLKAYLLDKEVYKDEGGLL